MSETLAELANNRRMLADRHSRVPGTDPVVELFQVLQMQSVFYTQAKLSEPWGMEIPAISDALMFHFVVDGDCRIEVEGEQRELHSGDFLLVPHGKGHCLKARSDSYCHPLFDLPIETVSGFYERLVFGGGGKTVQLLCGAVSFDHPIATKLLEMMPASLLIQAHSEGQFAALEATVRMLASESTEPTLGTEAVVTRLADLLVIQAMRVWLEQDEKSQRGWFSALQDPCLGKALTAVHQQPGADWSLEKMASTAGMSRTRFAETFKRQLGQSPMHYVTEWRMTLAKSRLQKTSNTILQIALDLGYQSEAAFGRAYKKMMGTTPGQERKQIPR